MIIEKLLEIIEPTLEPRRIDLQTQNFNRSVGNYHSQPFSKFEIVSFSRLKVFGEKTNLHTSDRTKYCQQKQRRFTHSSDYSVMVLKLSKKKVQAGFCNQSEKSLIIKVEERRKALNMFTRFQRANKQEMNRLLEQIPLPRFASL